MLRWLGRCSLARRENSFAEFDPRVIHHAARDQIAFFVFGNVFVKTVRRKLLHAELYLALGFVDVDDLGFDYLSKLQHVLRMSNARLLRQRVRLRRACAFFCADFTHMNHAFHAFGNLDKRAKLRQAGHRTFNS